MFTNTKTVYDVIGLLAQMRKSSLRGGLFHIHFHTYSHLLLNCVHKYTDIYDGIGLRLLKRKLLLKGGSTLYVSPYASPSELCS